MSLDDSPESKVNALRRILTWDETLFLWIRRFHRPWFTRVMRSLTHLGDVVSWWFFGLLLVAIGTEETQRMAYLLGWGAAAAAGIAQIVKRLSKRRRPDARIAGFQALVLNPDAFSFPSGHTAAAFGAAVALIGHGMAVAPLLTALATAIGFSRVYLGAHYPLDVAVGAAIGVGAGVSAQLVLLPMLY
jgi:undecaprenyl-diphosphatase